MIHCLFIFQQSPKAPLTFTVTVGSSGISACCFNFSNSVFAPLRIGHPCRSAPLHCSVQWSLPKSDIGYPLLLPLLHFAWSHVSERLRMLIIYSCERPKPVFRDFFALCDAPRVLTSTTPFCAPVDLPFFSYQFSSFLCCSVGSSASVMVHSSSGSSSWGCSARTCLSRLLCSLYPLYESYLGFSK